VHPERRIEWAEHKTRGLVWCARALAEIQVGLVTQRKVADDLAITLDWSIRLGSRGGGDVCRTIFHAAQHDHDDPSHDQRMARQVVDLPSVSSAILKRALNHCQVSCVLYLEIVAAFSKSHCVIFPAHPVALVS